MDNVEQILEAMEIIYSSNEGHTAKFHAASRIIVNEERRERLNQVVESPIKVALDYIAPEDKE